MRHRWWIGASVVALLVVGCAPIQDAQKGMAAHQAQIQAQTQQVVSSTVDVAFPVAHAPATLAVMWLFAWWYGRKDRLASKGKSETPALGFVAKQAPLLEYIVQHFADVFHGALNVVGTAGTPLNSAWKYVATAAIAMLTGAAANPQVQAWVAHNGVATLLVAGAGAAISALHTGIDPIKPIDASVLSPTTPTTPPTTPVIA